MLEDLPNWLVIGTGAFLLLAVVVWIGLSYILREIDRQSRKEGQQDD